MTRTWSSFADVVEHLTAGGVCIDGLQVSAARELAESSAAGALSDIAPTRADDAPARLEALPVR